MWSIVRFRHSRLSSLLWILVSLGAGCVDRPTGPGDGSFSIAVSPAVDTLPNIGDTVVLTAIVNGHEAGPSERITWTTLNGGVATVDSLGAVRAVAPGTAPIVALVNELADTALVVVSPPTLTQLALEPASITLAPGASSPFTVTGTWSDGSSTVPTVTYSANGGTITAGGLYTAGTTPGTFQVIAIHQGGTKADTSVVTVTAAPVPSLRTLASARGFLMGVAVRTVNNTLSNATYAAKLASQYNTVMPENAMTFGVIHPSQNTFSFTDADAVVSFAQAHGMGLHGTTSVWGEALPSWITGTTFTRAQLLQVLKNHITTVVGRYAGKVTSWIVVNEAVGWNGALKRTAWDSVIGDDYIDSAFVWTHGADPGAKLFYNDYGIEALGPKSDSVFALLQRLRARGVPVDGVGFQAHAFPSAPLPSGSAVKANFARFANAGYLIWVSEMDVMIPDTAGHAALVAQAVIFRDMLDACLLQTGCIEFTTWGVTDRYSWIPKWWPGYGRGLPLDSAYTPKPAFDSLAARLRRP